MRKILPFKPKDDPRPIEAADSNGIPERFLAWANYLESIADETYVPAWIRNLAREHRELSKDLRKDL